MDRLNFGLEIFGEDRSDSCGGRLRLCTDKENLRRALDAAMTATLTKKQHSIVSMFYFDGLSVTKIAYTLNLNKSTVSRHLSKSREKLKNYIQYGNYRLWKDKKDGSRIS